MLRVEVRPSTADRDHHPYSFSASIVRDREQL